MSNDLSTQTPVEIDTFLSANYQAQARNWINLATAVDRIETYEAKFVKSDSAYYRQLVLDIRAELASLQEERSRLITESAPYTAEYARRPWNRYYLVTNTNGHVHRGMNCSTCFADTAYGWLVELADCDEDAMVEEWGERACTVCFPDAPTNPAYHRPAKVDQEARAAREAEKAERQAAKDAKAITDLDGSPLKIKGGGVVKTKVAARNELSDAFKNLVYYGDHPADFEAIIRHLVPALEAAGVDWRKPATNAIKKVLKESNEEPAYTYLTAEQLAEGRQKIETNAKRAQALLAELS